MSALSFKFSSASATSDAISNDFFGMNTLFTRDNLVEGGAYDQFIEKMGTSSLRFPGGTITEELFSPDNEVSDKFWSRQPSVDAERGSDIFTNVPRFIEYANSINASVDWVLPSESLLSDERDADGDRIVSDYAVYNLLDRVDALIRGAYGQVDINTFSIGNEYWYQDRMTSSEYGKLANTVAKGLQRVFDTYRDELGENAEWNEPDIAIQTSLSFDAAGAQDIIEQLDLDARDAIDTVEQHYYVKDFQAADTSTKHFDRMDDFQNAEGFGDLNYYVSEWNVRLGDEADTGMQAASTLIEMTQTMLENGVDGASLWGTAYQSLQDRLAALSPDSSVPGGWALNLTPSGEVVRMMSLGLEGTRALDLQFPGEYTNSTRVDGAQDQVLLHAFGSDDKMVFFLSSRSDHEIDLTLDLSDLVGDYSRVWGQQLSAVDDPDTLKDESDATSKDAAAHLRTLTEAELTSGSDYHVSLGAYDIVRIEFTYAGAGTTMWGADQLIDPASDYDDELEGTSWDDTIFGNLGDDILRGRGGDDIVDGGEGDDVIYGGDGNDILFTGDGNDTVYGGRGEDIFVAQGGTNLIKPVEGIAHIIASTEGDTTIEGFDLARGDTLSFMRAYATAEDALEFASVQGDDLVFSHEDGGQTVILGAASSLDAISAAFSDFSDTSVVAPLLDDLVGEDPNDLAASYAAEINADPEVARLLLDGEPQDITDYIEGLDAGAAQELIHSLNIDALTSLIDADNMAALMNALDSDALGEFLDAVNPDTLLFQLAMIGDNVDDMLDAFDEDVLDLYLDRLAQADFSATPQSMQADELRFVGNALANDGHTLDDDYMRVLDDAEDEEAEAEEAQTITGAECFVATAAYADGNHPDVEYLRNVRDHILVHSALGRAFIWTYWRVGPSLARGLKPFPRLRSAARAVLGTLIGALRKADAVNKWGGEYRSTVYLSGQIRIAHAMSRKAR